MVLITQSEIICANAGDSRTVLCEDGQAVDLSKDHKPVDIDEIVRVNKAGGFVEDNRINGTLAVSRAFGDFQFKRRDDLGPHEQEVSIIPDIKTFPITAKTEFLVLACDGIWDVRSS